MEFMKKKLISLIKIMAIDLDEAVIDIIVDDMVFNSIEWRRKGNQVILHKFPNDELDLEFNWDELPKKTKKEIYLFLLRFCLN